jgi:hypothetical protein
MQEATMLPVDVVFLKIRRLRAAEERILTKANELLEVYPRLLGCRVVVDVPHRHIRGGKRFHVRVEMGLPNRADVIVERGPAGRATPADSDRPARHKADEIDGAFTDLSVVIEDVFAAARRRLQELARRRRETARAGTVSRRGAGARRRPPRQRRATS